MANSSAETSPVKSRFSGSDIDFFNPGTFDPNFTADISNKMQVPKQIRVGRAGGHEREKGDHDEMNGNWSNHRASDKMQMQVPDRIIVTGKEKHVGAKALPRELQLETVVMPPDPEVIRIQTPPRSITLQHAPQRQDPDYGSNDEDETLIVENNRARFEGIVLNGGGGNMVTYAGIGGADTSITGRNRKRDRDTSRFSGDENDEIEHLREQMSRMNRRLLAVEEDTTERKERERYMVLAGLFYVAYKTVTWLFRSSQHQ